MESGMKDSELKDCAMNLIQETIFRISADGVVEKIHAFFESRIELQKHRAEILACACRILEGKVEF